MLVLGELFLDKNIGQKSFGKASILSSDSLRVESPTWLHA